MKFWEAMKALEEGKKVRCSLWETVCWIDKKGDELGNPRELIGWSRQDWQLYEEPVQTLSFAEVVKGLKEGKAFKRKGWLVVLEVDDEGYVTDQRDRGRIFFQADDFEATDWVEVK